METLTVLNDGKMHGNSLLNVSKSSSRLEKKNDLKGIWTRFDLGISRSNRSLKSHTEFMCTFASEQHFMYERGSIDLQVSTQVPASH